MVYELNIQKLFEFIISMFINMIHSLHTVVNVILFHYIHQKCLYINYIEWIKYDTSSIIYKIIS